MAMAIAAFLVLLIHATHVLSSSSPIGIGIGINYGQIGDNLPPPSAVLPLLRSISASHVKLYDANPQILRSFANSSVSFTVSLPNDLLPDLRAAPSAALPWISANLLPFLSATSVLSLSVGNEVLSSNDSLLAASLLPAVSALFSALQALDLRSNISVTTTHSLDILATSFPPSAGSFRRDLLPYLVPLLAFLNKTSSPFLINAYPFFAYKSDPKKVPLNYVLFEPNEGVLDPGSGLRYDNMLHAQVDAVRSAIRAAAPGARIEVRVSETGWPSAGDADEVGATAENARKYNGNLMQMVAEGRGTPMEPGKPLWVYVFALFNENLKPGPASERHYGLFKPDGTPAYDLGIKKGSSGNSSAGGGNVPAGSPTAAVDGGWSSSDNNTGFYTISAAQGWRGVAAATMVAVAAGLLVVV